MISPQPRKVLIAVLTAALGVFSSAQAQSITRTQVLKIAESYVQHRWESSSQNVRHGKDRNGVEVHTPDRESGRGSPLPECWRVNAVNVGVAYKWGGIDTPQSFDAGIRAGKAAGDVYTSEKRRSGEAAVSAAAAGIDCSGFICRCWKLTGRYSTNSLASVCQELSSPDLLQPADIMNQSGGHVRLFVKWLDADKRRALFYEAAPFSKTLASGRDIREMLADGYKPLRYRKIRD